MRVHDARELEAGSEVHADVCVIGAGPVGATVAAELASARVDVIVLEAGGMTPDDAAPPRGVARDDGLPYGVEDTRVRAAGGTAHAWKVHLPTGSMAARMRPFDPIDFAERDWVPGSGWPFDLRELTPFYERAYELAGLPPAALDTDQWLEEELPPLALDPSRVRTIPFHYASRERFTPPSLAGLPRARNAVLWHHADVIELATDPSARAVVGAVVRLPEGRGEVTVRAKVYVVAGGGVENARILLASTQSLPMGIGNDEDLVGRYFMEHPQGVAAVLVPRSPHVVAALRLYALHEFRGELTRRHLTLAAYVQTTERLLGYHAGLWPTEPDWLPDDLRDLALHAQQSFGPDAPLFAFSFLVEQAPNPDSRVSVSRDDLSLVVDWRLTPLEYRTLVRAQQIIQEEFHLRGLGTVFTKPYADETGGFETGTWRTYDFPIIGAHHHIGTTRMHENPRRGVVDADCKVHGVDNLYVVGTSVFPTSSHVNPTLTAIALGVRLGQHLGRLPALR